MVGSNTITVFLKKSPNLLLGIMMTSFFIIVVSGNILTTNQSFSLMIFVFYVLYIFLNLKISQLHSLEFSTCLIFHFQELSELDLILALVKY